LSSDSVSTTETSKGLQNLLSWVHLLQFSNFPPYKLYINGEVLSFNDFLYAQ
jgi:hypothetical protein